MYRAGELYRRYWARSARLHRHRLARVTLALCGTRECSSLSALWQSRRRPWSISQERPGANRSDSTHLILMPEHTVRNARICRPHLTLVLPSAPIITWGVNATNVGYRTSTSTGTDPTANDYGAHVAIEGPRGMIMGITHPITKHYTRDR